jgi:hypothetical protein
LPSLNVFAGLNNDYGPWNWYDSVLRHNWSLKFSTTRFFLFLFTKSTAFDNDFYLFIYFFFCMLGFFFHL